MVAWQDTSESFHRYLLTRGRSKDTAASYVSHLHTYWEWCGGETALASADTVERYLEYQLGRYARSTAHARLSAVKAYYSWLRAMGFRKDNPAIDLTVRKEKHLSRPPVDEGDELRLLSACKNDEERLLFVLGFRLGLRISEIIGLRADDLYLERRLIYVHGKGSKERMLPLKPEVLRALALVNGERANGLIFRGMTREQARRIMMRVAKNAGVKGFYPHKMRISFAVKFLDMKHDVDSLQTLMGHASADVTIRYASFNRVERAMQQMRSLDW